jgi:hypothetical protein
MIKGVVIVVVAEAEAVEVVEEEVVVGVKEISSLNCMNHI